MKRPSCIWVGLFSLLCLLGFHSGSLLASENGSIRGSVQLHDNKGVAEHRIMLIRFGPNQEVQRIPGQTDAQGRFVFDNLETGETFEYVVGIRYNGQLHRSDSIKLEKALHRTGVLVRVGQEASQAPESEEIPSVLQVPKRLMMVIFKGDHLKVREVLVLRYTGSVPYTGTASHAGNMSFSLHLPLPEGYYDLGQVQGLDVNHVHRHPSGLYYTAPISAGEHRVVYTYALPFRHDQTILFATHSLPTSVFDVFVEDTHLVATSNMPFEGPVVAEPHAFLHFRATGLSMSDRSWLQLTQHAPTPSWLRVGAYGLTFAIALLGIVIPVFGNRRKQGETNPSLGSTTERVTQYQAAYQQLLLTIAKLDDQFDAGSIAEEVYRRQRQVYKQQIVELAIFLQESPQKKGADR